MQVNSADRILELLNLGNSRRKTESTEVNGTSSRWVILLPFMGYNGFASIFDKSHFQPIKISNIAGRSPRANLGNITLTTAKDNEKGLFSMIVATSNSRLILLHDLSHVFNVYLTDHMQFWR